MEGGIVLGEEAPVRTEESRVPREEKEVSLNRDGDGEGRVIFLVYLRTHHCGSLL